ncbi:hypothetical protein CLV41_11145 [Roseibium marinum]|uniref:Uncharacterized protein n=1 Tax=Roseibium marinum TaxID=281252 RepID=A0A2S3UM73_9HYPH|nr:hypothetical protein CLV41_11145 [Roseibium marinum]
MICRRNWPKSEVELEAREPDYSISRQIEFRKSPERICNENAASGVFLTPWFCLNATHSN